MVSSATAGERRGLVGWDGLTPHAVELLVSVLRECDPGTCGVSPWLLRLGGSTPCPGRTLLSFPLFPLPGPQLPVHGAAEHPGSQARRGEPCSTLDAGPPRSCDVAGCRRWVWVGVSEVSPQFLWKGRTLADDYGVDGRPVSGTLTVSRTRPGGHRRRKGSSQLTLSCGHCLRLR